MRTGTLARTALLALALGVPTALALDTLPQAPLATSALPIPLPVALPTLPLTVLEGAPDDLPDAPILALLPDEGLALDTASGTLFAPHLPTMALHVPATRALPLPHAAPTPTTRTPTADYLGHKRDAPPVPHRPRADVNPFDGPTEAPVRQTPPAEPQHLARPAARPQTAGAPTLAPPPTPTPRAIALTACGALLLLAPLGALYHRFRASESDRRAKILAMLHASPGTTQADVARQLDVDPATARYHLARLAKDQLASEHESRWFAAGSVPPTARAAHLAQQDAGHVLDAIRAHPGATKADLSRALAIGRSSVTWHLTTLEKAGLVRLERAGKSVRVTAA